MLRVLTYCISFLAGGYCVWMLSGQTKEICDPPFVVQSQYKAPESGPKRTVIQLQEGGAFEAEGTINGAPTRFLLDTGATSIVLTDTMAATLGIRVSDRDFTARALTASGIVNFARVNIDSIQIGDVTVRNVPAAVQRGGHLGVVILGMRYLALLKRVELQRSMLILEQ